MTAVCCFERVISILLISVDRVSCLSRNVSSIIQIWRDRLLLNGRMYQISKAYKENIRHICFSMHSVAEIIT